MVFVIKDIISQKRLREECEKKPFFRSFYPAAVKWLCREHIEMGGTPSEFRAITNAYFHAKPMTESKLVAGTRADDLGRKLHNPCFPDETMVRVSPVRGKYFVPTTDPNQFKRNFTSASLLVNLFDSGNPGERWVAENRAESEKQHEQQHASAFADEPGARVTFNTIFYKDEGGSVVLYPGVNVSGEFSLGSYRRSYQVDRPSRLDAVHAPKLPCGK